MPRAPLTNVVVRGGGRLAGICIAAYIVVAVVCFGPAMVETERTTDAFVERCRAEHADDPERRARCRPWAPGLLDASAKALAWPLWLSYALARGAAS